MQKIKFRFKGAHLDSFAKLGELRAVFLDLTNRCNLSCKYCFNSRALRAQPEHLELELIGKALDSGLAGAVKDWFLSGGEPVLYRYLPEALQLFRERGIGPKIATNGTMLSPSIIDTWVDNGVRSLQFSVDTLNPGLQAELNGGDGKDHETLLRNLEYAVRSPLRVVVSSVLTELNLGEIKNIMAFCFESGVDSYTLYPNVPAEKSCGRLVVPFPDLLELSDDLFSLYNSLSSARVLDITLPCFAKSPAYAKWKDILNLRLHYCAAAQYALKITSGGRVSACICQDSDPFIIGDLRRESLDDIWASEKAREFRALFLKIPECSRCPESAVCRGGCRNNASLFGSNGLLSLDPYCRYFKSG